MLQLRKCCLVASCRAAVGGMLLGAMLLAVPASAAMVTWSGATNIVGDSDVVTQGVLVAGGYYSTTANPVTLNGVVFTGSGDSVHLPGTTVTFNAKEFGDPAIGAGTGLSSNYRTLLGGRVFHTWLTNANTVTLQNLEIGSRYLVQVWIQDSRTWGFGRSNTISAGGNAVALDYNTTDAVGGRGQYCVGTFVADGLTQAITLKSATLGQMNALQVRLLAPPATHVMVSVAATQVVRSVDSRMFSANTAIYDAQLHGPASVPLLFEQDNQALRWPGGSYGDTFHQATEHLRPGYEPRTTNFLYLAKHTGAELFMIANYGTGTPEEAADWVRYVNITNTAGAKYWEIGNEIFGTWEAHTVIAPFTTNDILNLSSLASKLYTPTNNISTYVRGTLSASTLTTLTNYMSSPGPNAASLASALAGELNQLVNGTPSPVKVYDPARFAGVTLRPVTSNNVALPIPTAGQDVNNRMVLEDAYPSELAKVSPAVDLASNWPDVHLPHEPWTYAQRFAQYYTQMKAVDPTIRLGAVGVANESSWGNGYTHHPAVNPRTGTTNYGWMPVVLATLKSLGVTPDFLIHHDYAGSGDAALLQWSTALTRDGTNMQQMLADYMGPAAATSVQLCITEIGPSGSDQSSTSLVGGLFLADNAGQALLSPFSARLWWAFRNGGSSVAANTNIYGWRNFQDYGQVPRTDSTALTNRYPTYYCAKLLQYWARGGDTVVEAASDSPLLSTYAVRRVSGELALLVINKSPDLTLNGTFELAGFAAGTNATLYSYGIPQDETVRTNGTLSPDLAVSSLAVTNPSELALSFAPYSATVISLAPGEGVNFTRRHQAFVTFNNYPRSEVLTNFPALVVLGTNVPGFAYDQFSSPTAGDLRFKTADGTQDLNYEIERWNPRGESLVWVQIPRFTNNVSILAQWGGPDTQAPNSTRNGSAWSNGYVGVWHWQGLGSHDSSVLGQETQTGGSPTVLGRAGAGRCFRRFSLDTMQVPWLSAYDLPTHFEVQGWFKVEPWEKPGSGDYLTLTGKQAPGDFNNRNWWVSMRNDGKLWWRGSPGIDVLSPGDLADGAWHHFAAVHDGAVAWLYVDGVQVAADTTPGTASVQNAPVTFGEEYGTGRRMRGLLDEMRLSNVARSSNWVWATYQSIASNSLFTSYAAATTNTPPVLSAIPDQVIGAGMTLLVTNTATDMDLPAQSLNYGLLVGPAGASINTNSGRLSWRPSVAQANTTHLFTVSVRDDGLPSLSSTQTFQVVVSPLNRPSLTRAGMTNGVFALTVTGDPGPDYTLQASTNLTTWITLFTSNSPALPIHWLDEDSASVPFRFYRVLLGP